MDNLFSNKRTICEFFHSVPLLFICSTNWKC